MDSHELLQSSREGCLPELQSLKDTVVEEELIIHGLRPQEGSRQNNQEPKLTMLGTYATAKSRRKGYAFLEMHIESKVHIL